MTSEIEPVYAWEKAVRELPHHVACELAASGVVSVRPLAPPRWLIQADSHVGVLVGESFQLRILPHIGVAKLIFLLSYSLKPEGWEGVLAALQEERDVIQALASSFCLHARRLTEQGLLHGYVNVDERRNALRGRVRFGDQLARLGGLPLPIEVSYDEFTVDIAENRLLRAAAERLLLSERVAPPARSALVRLRCALDQVQLTSQPPTVELPPLTPLNRRYETALVLAKLILDGSSLAQRAGPVAARSFLFDMNEVFESFLFAALREAMRWHGGMLAGQLSDSLDEGPEPALSLRPDIIWRRHGTTRAVIDAKYATLAAAEPPPSDDIYQMLAYCIGFGVRRGTLIYAHDERGQPQLHKIKRHGYEIDIRALDLRQQPAQLLAQVKRIAEDIAAAAAERTGTPAVMALVA